MGTGFTRPHDGRLMILPVALMNAINVMFPEAAYLLCHFHIDKNVKAKCKMIVHPKEACG